jgi:hypothetical protein
MQRNEMQCKNQPVRVKAGGKGWTCEMVARQKVTQGGGGATRFNMTTSQKTRGNREEKWTTGGGASRGRGCSLRE